jgi:hypothetical protein
MFSYLQKEVGKEEITSLAIIKKILSNHSFTDFSSVNVLPIIYNEKKMTFKIIILDLKKVYRSVKKIQYLPPRKYGKKKTFPIYKFYGNNDQYIFEVRYGGARANALQRGMWTHTENAALFFRELLSGEYEVNKPLIILVSKILVSKKEKHEELLKLFPKSKQYPLS